MRLSLPSSGSRSSLGGSLAIVLLCLCASPAAADWIVLRDGKVLQTDGPWAVEGERLIFTSTAGRRSALPLDEVDLESSRQASGTTANAWPASIPVASSDDSRAVGTEDPEAALSGLVSRLRQPNPRALTNVGDSLVVSERRDELNGGALHLTGKLSNSGRDSSRNISLIATLYDDEGEILEFAKAQLSSRNLGPGQRTNFKATFPGLTTYSRVTFEGTVPPPEPEVTEEMVAEAIARAKADAQRREKEREAQLRAETNRRKQQEAARREQATIAQRKAPEDPGAAAVPAPSGKSQPAAPPIAQPATAAPNRLLGVRADQVQAGTVVTVEASRGLDDDSFSQFRLDDPPRLVLRIRDVTEPYDVASLRSPEIVQARAGLHSTAERGDEIHLVFELASEDVDSSVSTRGGQVVVKLEQR